MMYFNRKKKSKLKIILTVLIAIALLTGMLLLNTHRQFGARLIRGYEENKYGDFIGLEYDGTLYASLDIFGRYSLLEVDEELTRIRTYSYWKSVLHNYKVYSVEDDPEHIFLDCDPRILIPRDLPKSYYRADYMFPELKSNNIEKIRMYDWDGTLLCALEDKEMIKYFLDEKTKIGYNDVISYIESLDIKVDDESFDDFNIRENADSVYVYAKFKDSPLHYELGLLTETEREYYEYGERDDTNDYDGYDVFE
ncbi:MAG: hypothetical protein IJN88_03290 [Clostridia bacterium]|nr:hypothetical protein [Clostridia bacterium]